MSVGGPVAVTPGSAPPSAKSLPTVSLQPKICPSGFCSTRRRDSARYSVLVPGASQRRFAALPLGFFVAAWAEVVTVAVAGVDTAADFTVLPLIQ